MKTKPKAKMFGVKKLATVKPKVGGKPITPKPKLGAKPKKSKVPKAPKGFEQFQEGDSPVPMSEEMSKKSMKMR